MSCEAHKSHELLHLLRRCGHCLPFLRIDKANHATKIGCASLYDTGPISVKGTVVIASLCHTSSIGFFDFFSTQYADLEES